MSNNKENTACCAHSRVILKHKDYPDGSRSDYWECESNCGKQFIPIPVPIETGVDTNNKGNLPCPHGCSHWGHCPWCLGINGWATCCKFCGKMECECKKEECNCMACRGKRFQPETNLPDSLHSEKDVNKEKCECSRFPCLCSKTNPPQPESCNQCFVDSAIRGIELIKNGLKEPLPKSKSPVELMQPEQERVDKLHKATQPQPENWEKELMRLLFGSETAKPNKTFIALESFIRTLIADERDGVYENGRADERKRVIEIVEKMIDKNDDGMWSCRESFDDLIEKLNK